MPEFDKTMVMGAFDTARDVEGPPARLLCVDPSRIEGDVGLEITLEGLQVRVGRGADNDVVLKAEGVSKNHARFFPHAGQWHVEDAGSTNGIRVNNSTVPRVALNDGDTVAIGRALYKFQVEPTASRKAAAPQLDIGDGEKTVMMRPGQRPPEVLDAAATAPAAASPKPAARAATGKKGKGGAGSGLWIIAVVLGIAIVAGAVYLIVKG